jgi:hypothetical protein
MLQQKIRTRTVRAFTRTGAQSEWDHNFVLVLTDSITAVEYNSDGEYLATGDRVGRVTVLRLENEGKAKVCSSPRCAPIC